MLLKESNLAVNTIYGNYEDDSWDDISRIAYSTGLKIAVIQAKRNKPIGEYNKKRLVKFDSILEIIEENFNEKNFGWSIKLYGDSNESPSKHDIKKKFDEIIFSKINTGNLEYKDQFTEEYFKLGFNALKNHRRVLYRLLNNEPLELIKRDVNDFEKFADELRNPPEEDVLAKYRRFI